MKAVFITDKSDDKYLPTLCVSARQVIFIYTGNRCNFQHVRKHDGRICSKQRAILYGYVHTSLI